MNVEVISFVWIHTVVTQAFELISNELLQTFSFVRKHIDAGCSMKQNVILISVVISSSMNQIFRKIRPLRMSIESTLPEKWFIAAYSVCVICGKLSLRNYCFGSQSPISHKRLTRKMWQISSIAGWLTEARFLILREWLFKTRRASYMTKVLPGYFLLHGLEIEIPSPFLLLRQSCWRLSYLTLRCLMLYQEPDRQSIDLLSIRGRLISLV